MTLLLHCRNKVYTELLWKIIHLFTVFSSHSDKTMQTLSLRLTNMFHFFLCAPSMSVTHIILRKRLFFGKCAMLFRHLKCILVNYFEYCGSVFDTAELQASAIFRLIWRGYFCCSRQRESRCTYSSYITHFIL